MQRIDFFGFPYDDSIPAFLLLPRPPHTLNEAGDPKLVLHRVTSKQYDYAALLGYMAEAGYTAPTGEIGEDDDWIRENTDLDVPYEYTLTQQASSLRPSKQPFFTLSGPAVATKQQRIRYNPGSVSIGELTFPNGALGNPPLATEATIMPGDTIAQVAAKLGSLDVAMVYPTGYLGPNTALVSGFLSSAYANKDFRLTATGSASPTDNYSLRRKGFARLTQKFGIEGMNMIFLAGMKPPPRHYATSELSDDRSVLTITFKHKGYIPIDQPSDETLSLEFDFLSMGYAAVGYPGSYGFTAGAASSSLIGMADTVRYTFSSISANATYGENGVNLTAVAQGNVLTVTGVDKVTGATRYFDFAPRVFFWN